MARQTWLEMIPIEWAENERKGLCPVCGVSKEAFDHGMQKFCSEAHRKQYMDKILTWQEMRAKVLERDHYTCAKCGITQDKLNKEYNQMVDTWKKENFDYLTKNEKFINAFRKENEEEISRAMEYIMERMERIASPEAMADYVLNHTPGYFFQEHNIKLPHKNIGNGNAPAIQWEVDHIKAIVNGGNQWDMNNLQTLCHECHVKKTKEDIKKHKENKVIR